MQKLLLLLLGVLIGGVLYLVIKLTQNDELLTLHKKKEAMTLERIKFYQYEEEIQRENIGDFISISSLKYSNTNQRTMNNGCKNMILVFQNHSGDETGFVTTVRNYASVKNSYDNKSHQGIIIITPFDNVSYLKSMQRRFSTNVTIAVDTNSYLYKQIGLSDNVSAVYFINEKGICVYCHLIDSDNLRNLDQMKIGNEILKHCSSM